jgi:hypothetical protein
LFGFNVSSGSALIDLDGSVGALATATRMPVGSDTNSINGTPTSSVSKRKSGVWVDFEEIYKVVNGNKV